MKREVNQKAEHTQISQFSKKERKVNRLLIITKKKQNQTKKVCEIDLNSLFKLLKLRACS